MPKDIDKTSETDGGYDIIPEEYIVAMLGVEGVPTEFLSCCTEFFEIVNRERFVQGKRPLNESEKLVFIHEIYKTYCKFRGRLRKDGSSYFLSHLYGTVKYLVRTEGIVGLPPILAAFQHDNFEELIDWSSIRAAEAEAMAKFKPDPGWSETEVRKKRVNFSDKARRKALKIEERRLAGELIDMGDYLGKLSGNVSVHQLNELMVIVRTLVEGVTKFRKAESEATAEATFMRLLHVALEAIRTIYVKLADRAHNVETISAHTKEAQERIMAETEIQYLALARILRIREIVRFYTEECCGFFNKDLRDEFAQLASNRKGNFNAVKRDEILKFFERKSLGANFCKILEAKFVDLGLVNYVALVDKPFKAMKLQDLPIGPFDPMEEILITIDLNNLKNPKSRLYALSQLATIIEQKFASTDKSQFVRDIAPAGDPDNVLGMRLVCYNPEFGHLRLRINDRFSEARSKRGVLAEKSSNQTPKDVQEMIQAILNRTTGSFHGISGTRQVALAELLRPRIAVRTPKGDVYSLPRGSTGLDFAAAIHGNLVIHMSGLMTLPNLTSMEPAKKVDKFAPLEDGSVYIVQTDETSRLQTEWLLFANTIAARAIREHLTEISNPDGSNGRAYLERLSGIFNISVEKLLQVINAKYPRKSSLQILHDIGTGLINPIFILSKHIEFRNNRWKRNVIGGKKWDDLRKEGVSDESIEADIAKELDGISKWEVEVCVPEEAGSLKDFSGEFGSEVGIKIDQIRSHTPGRSGESGRLKLLFDLKDSSISVYEFFVKLIKMNFEYPVKITQPIVEDFEQMKQITAGEVVSSVENGAPDRN